MRPKPLYRSITFWSGIFAMVFICWAWWDSSRRWSYLTGNAYALSNRDSGLALFHEPLSRLDWRLSTDNTMPGQLGSGKIQMRFGRPGLARVPDPRVEELGTRQNEGESTPRRLDPILADFGYPDRAFHRVGSWLLFIPHWIILLGIALPWSGLIFWRSRRHGQAIVFLSSHHGTSDEQA